MTITYLSNDTQHGWCAVIAGKIAAGPYQTQADAILVLVAILNHERV